MKLKWIIPTKENPPPLGIPLICKFKHGIIEGVFDNSRFKETGEIVGYTYVWQDIEYYIYSYITRDEFDSYFEKDEE